MIGRYVRLATLGFSLFSVFYWMGIAAFIQIIDFVQDQGKVSGLAERAATAVPAIVYGVLCALFLQWFARGIVRRIQSGDNS